MSSIRAHSIRRRRSGFVVPFLLVGAVAASAADDSVVVRVKLTGRATPPSSGAAPVLRLEVRSAAGDGVHGPTEVNGSETGYHGSLELPSGSWILRASDRSPTWFKPIAIVTTSVSQEVDLGAVFEKTAFRMAIEGTSVTSVRVRFRLSGAATNGYQDEVSCERIAADWVCALPRAELDLRVEAGEGFVPEHRWGVLVTGPGSGMRLIPRSGSSCSFWVTGLLPERSTVEARIQSLDSSRSSPFPPTAAPFGVQRVGPTRAFLSVGPIPEGRYEVQVKHEGTLGVRLPGIAIGKGEAKLLPAAIHLDRESGALRVHVQPALTPSNRPWTLQLLFSDSAQGGAEEVGRWEFEGVVSLSSLATGTYRARLLDERGDRWVDQLVELGDGSASLEFDLRTFRVIGQVLLGDEPLRSASLFLRAGGVSRRFESDGDGRFSGELPSEGTWSIQVRSKSPQVDRTVAKEIRKGPQGSAAEIEIALPGAGLSGRVVGEDGAAAARSVVMVRLADSREESFGHVVSDERGRFELRGLSAGTYVVWAERGEEASDEVEARVEADEVRAEEVELRLSPKATLTGTVSSAMGPLASAQVEFRSARAAASTMVEQVVVDLDGGFSIRVPKTSFPVLVTAVAPGHPSVVQLAGSSNQPLEIVLPTEAARVTVEAAPAPTSGGAERQLVLIVGGLPLLDGPTGAFRRRVDENGRVVAHAVVTPGSFVACAGSFADLDRLISSGVPPRDVMCESGSAGPGEISNLRLGSKESARPE